MLHDRPYMRTSEFGTHRPMWMILIFINVACFIAQWVISQTFVYKYLALSQDGIRSGFIWQLLTFQFLHGGLFHLFTNMFFGVWMFGRFIEERLGSQKFLQLYLLGGVAGGLLQVILGFIFPQYFGGATIGASAGTFALIAAFCALDPYAEIRLFFILPMRARHLLYLELGIAFLFTIMPTRSVIAHAAHLGGALFALAYIRWAVHSTFTFSFPWRSFRPAPRRQVVRPIPGKPAAPRKKTTALEQDLPPEEFISQEVDPILDKISSQGIHSLNERERKILEAARKKMSKR